MSEADSSATCKPSESMLCQRADSWRTIHDSSQPGVSIPLLHSRCACLSLTSGKVVRRLLQYLRCVPILIYIHSKINCQSTGSQQCRRWFAFSSKTTMYSHLVGTQDMAMSE